jgi:5-methyltetrahydrofolate--homocysteine methyltransferase
MSILLEIKEATIAGNQQKVTELTKRALEDGFNAGQVIQDGFIPAMGVVGDDFGVGKIYIPEMLIAARAMKTGIEILKPALVGEKIQTIGKVVIGTVQGDMHDIGKNLVIMMLEGSGFEVFDLGTDVPSVKFVEAVRTHQPQFVAMSALLTTTMEQMKIVIEALKQDGLREKVKVLVGGAPVSREFAEKIGADGYGKNAGDAAKRMKGLLN